MEALERRRRWKLYVVLLLVALVISIIFSTCLGSTYIPPLEALKSLFNWAIPSLEVNSLYEQIVIAVRLPRVVLGCLVGAALSLAGVLLQGVFRNPMADPYIIGVSSGAALGAALAIVLGLGFALLGSATIPVMAFAFAMATLLLVYNLSRVGGRVPVMTLLLSGIAVSIFLSSITTFISMFAGESLHGLYFWLLGSLSLAQWSQVMVIAPVVVSCSVAAMLYARDLNIMLMGEETATTLGVNVEDVKLIVIVISSLVTA
ncbi:MAG: iron ABC transporter permease, partial [Thermoprotei archaeon]